MDQEDVNTLANVITALGRIPCYGEDQCLNMAGSISSLRSIGAKYQRIIDAEKAKPKVSPVPAEE